MTPATMGCRGVILGGRFVFLIKEPDNATISWAPKGGNTVVARQLPANQCLYVCINYITHVICSNKTFGKNENLTHKIKM